MKIRKSGTKIYAKYVTATGQYCFNKLLLYLNYSREHLNFAFHLK